MGRRLRTAQAEHTRWTLFSWVWAYGLGRAGGLSCQGGLSCLPPRRCLSPQGGLTCLPQTFHVVHAHWTLYDRRACLRGWAAHTHWALCSHARQGSCFPVVHAHWAMFDRVEDRRLTVLSWH